MNTAVTDLEGQRVWVPDKSIAWAKGTVKRAHSDGKTFDVQIDLDGNEPDGAMAASKGVVTVNITQPEYYGMDGLPLQNKMPATGVEDMCSLNYLHEPAILANLRQRFFSKLPYTSTGEICIALNPYQWLDIYNDRISEQYGSAVKKSDLPPHPFATSAAAYRGLKSFNKNQSILVSGESGAGKTETVKILLNHLAQVAGAETSTTSSTSASSTCSTSNNNTIEKVIKSNPLLESFGNAKTVRNDNSSRFGKFTELQFSESDRLVGSNINTYLLEKTRVVYHSAGERSYHVFYQLLAAPESVKERCGLGGRTKQNFLYCFRGADLTNVIEGVSDADRFLRTADALKLIGIDADTCDQLWGAVAAVLELGQIEFVSSVTADGQDSSEIKDAHTVLQLAASMLGVEAGDLGKHLTHRVVTARNETFNVQLTVEKAAEARDGLAKEVYYRLFEWLVKRINESTNMSSAADHKVGLLDIFGFESFVVNSFEQFCINLANEKLQQKFTEDVFKTVQVEYLSEGIAWSHIDFKDNAATLDLIEGFRTGILAVLDEECMLPKGSNESFVAKIGKQHAAHSNFIKSKQCHQCIEFTVKHYAGDITYTATSWLDKNKDTLQADLLEILQLSTCQLIQTSFATSVESDAPIISPTGKVLNHKRKGSLMQESLGSKFRRQLNGLMSAINMTEVQYVRCIKPNKIKSSKILDNAMVVEQLRCAGVIEAIRISRAAFPNRLPFDEFMHRYSPLIKNTSSSSKKGHRKSSVTVTSVTSATAATCKQLIEKLLPKEPAGSKPAYAVGASRIYFRSGVVEELEQRRGVFMKNSAVLIQGVFATHLARTKYLRLRCGAIMAQKMWRKVAAVTLLKRLRAEEAARIEAARLEALRIEAERLAALQREQERLAALRREEERLAKIAAEERARKLLEEQKVLEEQARKDAEAKKAALAAQQQAAAAAAAALAAERAEIAAVAAADAAQRKAAAAHMTVKSYDFASPRMAGNLNAESGACDDDFMFNEHGHTSSNSSSRAKSSRGRSHQSSTVNRRGSTYSDNDKDEVYDEFSCETAACTPIGQQQQQQQQQDAGLRVFDNNADHFNLRGNAVRKGRRGSDHRRADTDNQPLHLQVLDADALATITAMSTSGHIRDNSHISSISDHQINRNSVDRNSLSPRTARRNSYLAFDNTQCLEAMNSDLKRFLTSSIPRSAGTVKCYLRRERGRLHKLGQGGESYSVYIENNDGTAPERFLLCAQKRSKLSLQKNCVFSISCREGEYGKGSADGHIGTLKATSKACDEFQLFDESYDPDDSAAASTACGVNAELGAIRYLAAVRGDSNLAEGPRQMQVALSPCPPSQFDTQTATAAECNGGIVRGALLDRMKRGNLNEGELALSNRTPKWNSRVKAYVLNFNGRVTQASVKNFQLVETEDAGEKIKLQFGRISNDEFTMDVAAPLSILQAFAVTLTSFESK